MLSKDQAIRVVNARIKCGASCFAWINQSGMYNVNSMNEYEQVMKAGRYREILGGFQPGMSRGEIVAAFPKNLLPAATTDSRFNKATLKGQKQRRIKDFMLNYDDVFSVNDVMDITGSARSPVDREIKISLNNGVIKLVDLGEGTQRYYIGPKYSGDEYPHHNHNDLQFGDQLKKLRIKSELSMCDAAHAMKISEDILKIWEENGMSYVLDFVRRICSVYDISPNELFQHESEGECSQRCGNE